jgi:hypothetical protein
MTKSKIIKASAVAIDVGVPLIATLTQFPVWVEKSSEATVSGLFLIFAVLSCIPFYRQLREWIKSPSAPIVWAVIFAFLACLNNIIDEMVIVAFWGFLSNLLGLAIYKIGEHIS